MTALLRSRALPDAAKETSENMAINKCTWKPKEGMTQTERFGIPGESTPGRIQVF
jgi:hypothetical protein